MKLQEKLALLILDNSLLKNNFWLKKNTQVYKWVPFLPLPLHLLASYYIRELAPCSLDSLCLPVHARFVRK